MRRWRPYGRRHLLVLDAPPAGEEIKDGDDHGERRQDEHSVNRVHPVEGPPFSRIRLRFDYEICEPPGVWSAGNA